MVFVATCGRVQELASRQTDSNPEVFVSGGKYTPSIESDAPRVVLLFRKSNKLYLNIVCFEPPLFSGVRAPDLNVNVFKIKCNLHTTTTNNALPKRQHTTTWLRARNPYVTANRCVASNSPSHFKYSRGWEEEEVEAQKMCFCGKAIE